MKLTERRKVLRDVAESSAWRTVRRWIRDMVRVEPRVMREVSRMEFGPLCSWIERGSANVGGVCGCLVGSTAIALAQRAGQAVSRDFYAAEVDGALLSASETVAQFARKQFVADMEAAASYAACAAAELGDALGQERAVALIKDEIVRALAARRRRAARRKALVRA